MNFCFVILHYQALEETQTCVDSILKVVEGEKNVIIVDNASPNGSGKQLKKYYQSEACVTVLLQEKNLGFARGNNVGYAYALRTFSPDFVVVMNNDMVIEQKEFIREIERSYRQYRFGVMGPDIYSTKAQRHQNPQVRKVPSYKQLKKKVREYSFKYRFRGLLYLKAQMMRAKDSDRKQQESGAVDKSYVDHVVINPFLHGSCYVFAADFMKKNPENCFYDQTFMYMEAEILYCQVQRQEIKMIYDPEIKIIHHEDVSTEQTFQKQYEKSLFSVKCLRDSCKAFIRYLDEEQTVKLLAFHLPQFHTCPENDAWWGEGFTEWTNTKKAKPLYKDHYQPREPYEDHYYDLSKLEDMLWQMKLAKEYGIGGFCYYHYWFHGKLLLHKPLECIRDYQGEKLDYCLCWANEPWTRAWEGKTQKILIDQDYGDEQDWEEHFQYLATFFKDPYYIKVGNRPVLVLYRCNNIPRCDEMIAYFEKRCIEESYDGIYLIEEMNSFQSKAVCDHSDAVLEFEPLYTMKYGRNKWERLRDKIRAMCFNRIYNNHLLIYRYDEIWNNIIHRTRNGGKMRFLGGFVDWDNTARKGTNGRVMLGTSPEKFEKYLKEQVKNAKRSGSFFVFINAWNEWGEGTYLEPDKKYGLAYLEKIKKL